METLEDRHLLAVGWDRVEPLGSLIFRGDIAGELGAPVSVFSDGFESGLLGPAWSTHSSTPGGRVVVSNGLGAPANNGAYHLAMDTTSSPTNNLNEAILAIDLSGDSNAQLEFAHKDVNDEDNALPSSFTGSFPGDGVSISDDGTTWHTLVSLNNANSPNNVYTEFNFDLSAAAATAGISLGANFQIKFQQFDGFPFNTDGRTFDDVTITATQPTSETTTAFLEADQTLTVVATPQESSVTLTVTVRDPGNAIIASGTASGPGETIDLQTIGIVTGGDYTVEVSADSSTEYDLVLYRNATVEVVDTDDGAELDATSSFIPLGSGRFGIVGSGLAADIVESGGTDVDEYPLDLTGKAGQPIDIAFSTDIDLASGTGAEFHKSLTETNTVFAPNVLNFDFTGAPSPTGDATLRVDAIADLDASTEFLTLDAEGIYTQQLFVTGGLQHQPVSTTLTIPEATLVLLAADGTVSFTITPSAAVNNLDPSSLTLDLTYAAVSGGTVTLELVDTDGTTVLASGMDVSDNFELGILDFIVPADGIYTVRVSSTSQGDYAIVVTDSLVFDTEPNEPSDAPLRSLDLVDGALGYVGTSNDIDLSLITGFDGVWDTFIGAFQVEPEADTYTITLSAGQQIGLSTSTPFDDSIDGLNLLDPTLEILDPNGVSVAFDANSGGDGKNAALPTFTAAAAGVYKVVVSTESDGAGEYVLAVNWAPVIEDLALSAGMIFENEFISVSGSYSDQNVDDSHTVVVDWDDPNDAADSTFALPATDSLSVGDTFNSTTDGAVLEIVSLDLLTGTVSFAVTDHQYLDDGPAPGNGTPSDPSTVTFTVTDVGGLVAATLTQEFIVNGDFETGDFTGWNITTTGSAAWLINDGLLDPSGPGTPLPPISGSFDAVSVESGPGVAILSEPIVVPATVSSAVLSWSDRIRNFADLVGQNYADPTQEWRVLILDSGGGLIQEVFSTNPGDPFQQIGPNARSFDLTPLFQSLAGQTIRISFEQQSQNFFFNATLDDVSLQVSHSPSVSVLVKNVAPSLTLNSVDAIDENEGAILTGTITDPGMLDEHNIVVDWDDPNDSAASSFTLSATNLLSVGDTFNSTTDTAVLEITAIDFVLGQVSFSVEHVYPDDGPAPGNSTSADTSTIAVTVNDDDGLHLGDFGDTTGLVLNGNAATPTTTDGTVLRLAATSTFQLGSAFSVVPVNVADSFSTQFSFRITDPGGVSDGTEGGADGITFTLQALGPNALGIAGGELGFGGLSPSVAIEFDTWQNPWDPSTNHLGVDVNGSVTSIATVDEPVNKWDNGSLYYSWIDYDGTILEVRVNTTGVRPATPNLALAIDIPNILGQNIAFAGFTGATGGAFGNHDIIGWQLADLAVNRVDVLVNNVAPVFGSVSTSATQGAKGQPGEDVTLAATFTDTGLLDRHGITIDWDDGTLNSVFDVDATADLSIGDTFASSSGDGATLTVTGISSATGEVRVSVVHQFATGGIFNVDLSVQDDDTGSGADGAQAWVTGLRVKNGVLQIIGSNADDHVTVDKQGNGLIKVHADFLQAGNFQAFDAGEVQQILAYMCDGDDHLTIAGKINLPAIIHGDGGDDYLNAGGGLTVLDGGTGNDHLNGGTGRDILIGGLGADRLVGNGNEDILIDGTTSYDDNDTALLDLLSEWGRTDEYSVRVNRLRNGTGLTGIKLALGETVFHDDDSDELTGSAGLDWLFYKSLEDDATDLKNNELEN